MLSSRFLISCNLNILTDDYIWATTCFYLFGQHLRWFGNNKGANKPAHPRSLISTLIIHLIESIHIRTCYKRNFNFLASLCSQAGWFESHFVGNPEDRCTHDEYDIKWALSRQNLSSRFPTKRVSNQFPQLQRLARKFNFYCSKFTYDTFQKANNKGADQTVQMRGLVCACVVRNPPKSGFLASRPKWASS